MRMSTPDRERGSRAALTCLAVLLVAQAVAMLWRIDAPFTEPAAYGRSTTNAVIARNFYEHGFRFFYPQLDFGPPPGYVGFELPLVGYLAAIGYLLAGVQDWVGRLVCALFGLGTTVVVYHIARVLYRSPAAWVGAATVVVLSPMFTFFSRTFQSDASMIFFACAALLALLRWRERGGVRLAVLACAAAAVAMVLKPSSLVLMPALLVVIATSGRDRWAGLAVALCAVVGASVVGYYLHAHAINQYHDQLGLAVVARRATVGRMLDLSYELQIVKDVVQTITPAGVLLLVPGLYLALRRREWWFLGAWVFGALCLDVAFNEAVSHHEYYQLIWLPAAALLAALVVEHVAGSGWLAPGRRRLTGIAVAAVMLALAAVLEVRFLAVRYQFPESARRRLEAGRFAAATVPPGALLAAEGIDVLYYAHRRGRPYERTDRQPVEVAELRRLTGEGAAYLVSSQGDRPFSAEALRWLASGGMVAERDGMRIWRMPGPGWRPALPQERGTATHR